MKVLTWNVHWKAMLGRMDKDAVENMDNFIAKTKPYDIICFQEAVNCDAFNSISSYTMLTHSIDNNVIVTLYDQNKYTLNKVIRGTMEDNNRLFMICFFNRRLAVINIHAGHKKDYAKLEEYISKVIGPRDRRRLKYYDIILLGDFNENVTSMTLFDRELSGTKTEPTCCYTYKGSFFSRYIFDHILSTVPVKDTLLHDVPRASDHKPVTATIDLPYVNGYDFDGVIHRSVGQPNRRGERIPQGEPIESSMIKSIYKEQLARGERVCIITARPPDEKNERTIRRFVPDYVPIIYTDGRSKSVALFQMGVNRYYEDSPLRIDETITSFPWLPLLKELYYVNPDDQTLVMIENSHHQYNE